jgi:hypothetical protein
MTKQEEIAHFQDFIEALPRDSYLRDLFAPLAAVVTDLIRNDVADSTALSDVWHNLARERKQLDELRKQHIAELQEHDKKARELRRAADLARGELSEILAQANSLIASTRHIIARAG